MNESPSDDDYVDMNKEFFNNLLESSSPSFNELIDISNSIISPTTSFSFDRQLTPNNDKKNFHQHKYHWNEIYQSALEIDSGIKFGKKKKKK